MNVVLVAVLFFLSWYSTYAGEFEEEMDRYRLSILESGKEIPDNDSLSHKKVLKFTIPQAIEQVIESNVIVQNAKLEIIKADSPEFKNSSKFTWKAVAGVQSTKQILPFNQNNIFAGTKRSQDRISAGIEKDFSTGTYIRAEISSLRFDTNAFENPNNPLSSGFSAFAAPPMYTGALSFKLSQELLKYSFGKIEENTSTILKNKTLVVRDNYINILTQLVVKILVDYWTLTILDSQIVTYEKLLKNIEEIRKITAKKKSLGLSESFEINQWNQAYTRTYALLEKARTDRLEADRNLVRILGVDPSSSISGVTDLQDILPVLQDQNQDIEIALSKRIDYKILLKQKKISTLLLENAMAEDMPSLKASVSYSSIGQNFVSPQDNFLMRERGITSFLFPQLNAEIDLSYPLWDKGVKAGIEEATINDKSTDNELALAKDTIVAEIKNRRESILASYELLQDFQKRNKELELFYKGLLERYKQGRFSAGQIKQALDALAQSELALVQAKVNFNINLIRYELAKNTLFEKYGVDIYAILEEIEKRSREMQ